jgi:hypothetical protein
MNYRELINEVLIRLREEPIATDWSGNINDSTTVTDYQKVVGALVNDAKRSVEGSHDWLTLRETFTITTVVDTMQYILGSVTGGAGITFKVMDVITQDTGLYLRQATNTWLNSLSFPTTVIAKGHPTHYGFNGSTPRTDGRPDDMNVDLYPVPDSVRSINFNIIKPQDQLKEATDIIKTPTQPVILGGWARAIAERGEDGGTQSSMAAQESLQALREAIMLDAGNTEYEKDWYIG